MSAPHTPLPTFGLEHPAAHKRRRLLAELTRLAEIGAPMPPYYTLALITGYAGRGTVGRAMAILADEGFIQIERGGNHRRVTIAATGRSTAVPQSWKPARPALPEPRRPIAEIIAVAAHVSALSEAEILGRSRGLLFARPRFLVCHFALAEGWGVSRIGRALGGRDHSTISYALRRVPELLEHDRLFCRLHDRMQAALAGKTEPGMVIVPARRAPAAVREIGDDGELGAPLPRRRVTSDPMLAALRAAHPERFVA
jgi:hypothetical protein